MMIIVSVVNQKYDNSKKILSFSYKIILLILSRKNIKYNDIK